MNFEQNFSPLDPNSEEYQSIGDEYLQIAPSVGGETEKRKQEKPITLKDLGLQKPVSQKKEVGLSGLEAVKLEDKAILSARQSQIELEDTYNNVVKSGTNYLNGVVQKLKQDKPEYQTVLSEFLREQASLNTPEQLKQRVDKSWDFLSSVSDINDNYATRDAWINSQYAGAYYSKSKAVKDEYESSDLKDKLTQRQYAGLRSLAYGKQSDFNDFVDVIKSQDTKQSEKDLVLAKLDKIGSNIDIAAGSAIGKDGGKLGIELFNEGKSGAKDAEDRLIQIEYDNPFTLQSFKDIASRAIERGIYSAEGADILTVTSENTGIPVERLAEINRFQQEARQSKAYEEFQKDMSFENFMKNPFGIIAELTLESLVAMYRHGASRMAAGAAEGAALGSVIPGFGTITGASTGFIAGSGLTSLNLEYSSKIMETLSEEGVDITNAESLRNAFGDEDLMDRARKAGWKKGVPVALFDMLSAGIAGKFVSKGAKAIMTTAAPTMGKKIFGGLAELGAQSALGGIGEAAGQIVEKGGIYDTNAIVMEMLGETFGSAGEIVTGRAFEIAKRNEPLKTRDLVSIISTNDKGFINNNIDAHLAAGVLNEEQAASLKNQLAYTEGIMNKLPSGMSIDGSANIIDLIGQRNAIISNAETLDDAFKKKANAEAKQIDEQILNIFNSEQNAIKESTGQKQVSPKQSGILQYEGIEGQQNQTPTEANDSNRPISSKAQFQVGKQDVGVYKKETSAITNKMNEIGGAAVEFTPDNAVNATSKSNVSTLSGREGIVKQPNTVSITDFNGIPMMLTISDELTTGSIVNPATGNVISDLNGGVGFNYSEGNTDLAWAYTDKETATDTLNYAKDIYQKNKKLFDKLWAEGRLPQNHIPVAVVKMGTEAINSNEAVFRVFLDNLQSLPKQNLKVAYSELVKDIDANYKRLSELSKRKTLSPSERNALNGYAQIKNEYLKKNKSMLDVVSNIAELNINTRPLITDRISSGEVGLLPAENRLKADKPVTKALMQGLPKSDIKKIHLGYIAEPLRDSAIKDVPARHIISFVGIDVSKNEPVQTGNHKNYPFALAGQGLGVVENTAHISSVMPTAYGNIVSKITDAVAKDGTITPSQAVSRALPSGLSNFIFRNKTLATNDNISKLIGFLNLSFPDVTFFTDKQSFEDVLSSEGVKEYLKDGDVIYGVTKDGNIYLNPEKATYNTAIHEMGHIWVDFIENTRPELFAQGLKLVEGTAEFEAAKTRLGDNVFARKEALATLIGNKGETIADAAMKSQFKEWLVGVWKYLQEVFPSLRKLTPQQIENLSLQDFLGGALQDILSGKPVSTQKSEYTAAESQFQKDIIPTGGVPSVPGETGVQKVEETGLPEKKKYNWEKGNEGRPAEGETMIPTSTGRYVAVETMNGQKMDIDRKMNEIEKAKPSFYKEMMSWVRSAMIDNQAKVLTALEKIGKQGQLVKAYLLTRNSASATATILADNAINEIYGDISKKKVFNINGAKFTEYQLFNQMIGYQRVISIQNQMNEAYKVMMNSEVGSPEYNISKQRLLDNNMIDANGEYLGETLDVEFAMGNVTSTQAKALLYEIRDAIGEDAFDKLMNSSEKYSKHFNDMMKSRLDAGLISQGTYDHLSKYFYAPTRYISDVLTDPILSMTEPTTSYGKEAILKMKKLAGGSENLNMSDYEGLLRAVTYASEYSIAENRATNRFYDLVSTNKSKFEESGIRIGTRLVPIEPSEEVKLDPIDKVIKAIQEGKKPNPLELPSGQKKLPFKGIQKAERGMQKAAEMGIQKYNAPTDIVTDENGNKFRVVQEPLKEGEDYIKTYFNGQRYDIIVPTWFATQWYNRNTITNRYVTGATSWIAKLTGSNVLRVIATGINPVFGVAQLIPDTISAYASTLEERKLPILIDYPVFFVKVLAASRDIKNKSKDFQEAVQYGATTNFYNGGMVSFERGIMGKEDNSLEKVIEEWNVPGLKQYIMGSKKITETTEQMSKVALYKSIRDAKINEFKKQNNREPNTQELEDIKIESGSAARATADFHRKGVLGGELNKIVPYLNAGIQVQRAVLTSAKNNPGKMLSSAFEFVSYGALLTLSALGMGDDDELKEKKRKAYLKLSDFDRDNRVLLYFVESKEKFISVKIPEFLVPLQSLQRRMIERVYLEKKSLTSKDAHEISRNVADAFPLTQFVNYEKVISRNPAASAYSKLVNNRDPYRQEEVVPYEKATFDYLEGAQAGNKRASKISQYIGKAARNPLLPEGLSPKRLDAAASSIPFQSNPFSGAILFGLEASTSEKDLFEERYGKSTAEKVLKASGLTDRYFKEGSKINQNITGLPMENVKERGEFKNTIAEMLLPRFDSAATKMTNPEAFKKVRAEFVKNEYQQLSPEQKQIARAFIEGELKAKAKSKTKDDMVIQIVKMEGSDAKVDGIIETLNTIKVTEGSKVKFIRDLVDAGLVSSADFTKTLNVRGRETLNNGQKNEYYEPQVGYIRDEIKKYIQEKRAAKLK